MVSAPNNYAQKTLEGKNNKAVLNSKENPDEIYIDCQPTGVSSKEITTYNLPINSGLAREMGQINFMKTSVHFFLFILGIIIIYIAVPMIYKMMVIDKVLTMIPNDTNDFSRKRRIRSADILLCLGFTAFIITSFYYGFQGDGDYTMITNGLFAFVILGISFSLILNGKLDSNNFLKTGNNGIKYEKDEEKTITFSDPTDVLTLLTACIGFMIDRKRALLHILSVELIVFILLLILYKGTGSIDKNDYNRYCRDFLLIYIPIFVSLFIFVSTPS
jgi:hypothetical protein